MRRSNANSSWARACRGGKPSTCRPGAASTAEIAGLLAFHASARSLQIGNGVEVIPLPSVTANLIAIFGGIVVFHDPIGSGPLEVGARFFAFCLVITGRGAHARPDARDAYVRSRRRL